MTWGEFEDIRRFGENDVLVIGGIPPQEGVIEGASSSRDSTTAYPLIVEDIPPVI